MGLPSRIGRPHVPLPVRGAENPVSKRAQWGAAVAGYLAYAAVVLFPVWSGRVEPKWDGREFNYPCFAYAAQALHEGRLPLWNPFSNCGEPYISDPTYIAFQPLAVAAALLRSSPFDGYMLLWAALVMLGGAGALFLVAALGGEAWGGLVAAIAYSLSGYFVGHGQHMPYLVTAAYVPWILAFAHLAVAQRSWAHALGGGVALGLSALGGYPALVIFEVLALALWLGLAFLVRWSGPAADHPEPLRRRALRCAAVLAIATVLLAVIWLAPLHAFLVEAAGFTDRTSPLDTRLSLGGNRLTLGALVTFLFPRLSIDHPEAFPCDISMSNLYLGALALPLLFAWTRAERRRCAWLVAFAAILFWITLGDAGGLRTLLYYTIPPTQYLRHNALLACLFMAPLAAGAGLGLGRLSSGEIRVRPWGTWLLCATGASALVAASFRDTFAATLASCIPAVAASAAALLAAVCLRSGARRPFFAAAIAAIVAADLAWHTRSNSYTAWREPGAPSLREMEQRGKTADPLAPRITDPRLQMTRMNLIQRAPAVEGFVALRSKAFHKLVKGRFLEVLARDRYWLSPSASLATSPEECALALAPLGHGDAIPVRVDRSEDVLPGPAVVPGAFGSARVTSYEPERVELLVRVPAGAGAVLVSTERTAPSWRLAVDGAAQPVAVVNGFFRGARLAPGEHRVVFEYRPRAFVPLMTLGYVAMAIAIGGAVLLARRRREEPRPPGGN